MDRKEGVKLAINKDNVQLSVNSANSGDGNETIKANFNSENINISFNSKYLIDIASAVEDKNIKISLKDSVSPVLIEDASDKNSYYVIMPMKIWFMVKINFFLNYSLKVLILNNSKHWGP